MPLFAAIVQAGRSLKGKLCSHIKPNGKRNFGIFSKALAEPMTSEAIQRLLRREGEAIVRLHHVIGGDSAALWRWLGSNHGVAREALKALRRHDALQPALPGLASPKTLPVDPHTLVRRAGAVSLGWADARYPAALKAAEGAPAVIYVKGDMTPLKSPCVAIVGSRRATRRARNLAFNIARDLAAHGVTVVSGLAAGVDGAAHRGALETGRTVAVTGCGIDRVYPAQHRALAEQITSRGAVISQFPCGSPPIAYHFPLRNDTIARLVLGVLVIEAPIRSGALITADLAKGYGKTVMACPGDAGRPSCEGSNRLLREGVVLVESARDVMEALYLTAHSGNQTKATANAPLKSEAETDFLEHFAGEAASVDELVDRSGRTVAQVRAILTELEILGDVVRLEGDRFEPNIHNASRSS